MTSAFLAFLPELVILTGALVLFWVSLGDDRVALARRVTIATGGAVLLAAIATFDREATLFSGAYRVDAFSQLLKVAIAGGFLGLGLMTTSLSDIRQEARAEYYLLLTISVTGLLLLVSSVDLITIVVSLQLSSFPLYLLVAMRRERPGQRVQMEAAMKYIMFGVGANGIMLFGMGYLFGLAGSTSLEVIVANLPPLLGHPLAIAGLGLTFAGLFYKLAVFPFHFWTPDVYQGASNQTTSLIASLPKVAAVAVIIRFLAIASPDHPTLAAFLATFAVFSMLYGNLIALVQTDFKRLLGFSGIAHAGYALVGFTALDGAGLAAALYYIIGYLFMVLACFVVICRVSKDGANVAISELAGLHRRSPLLAVTLLVGVFALAGIPPFVGFMAKVGLLTAAFARGHTILVVITMVNAAIAIYYYLRVIRETFFGEAADDASPIRLSPATTALCLVLIGLITALGVFPADVVDAISGAVATLVAP